MRLYIQRGCTASDAVRVALNLKGIDYQLIDINDTDADLSGVPLINDLRVTPVLYDQQRMQIESLAIIEYLDEVYPDVMLLPGTARDRVRVRSIAQVIISDINPMLTPRVRQYMATEETGLDAEAWTNHWVNLGFEAIEELLADNPATGHFCLGNTPTMADACLAPQVWHSQKTVLDLGRFPTVQRVYENCLKLEAFENVALELR
jgi:maleylacetoacetate isomerase